MNFSVQQQSTTSKASDTNVNTTEDFAGTCENWTDQNTSSSCEGVAAKKSTFPNTFTTPQNCFQLLNSPEAEASTLTNPSPEIDLQPMKNILPEDFTQENNSVQPNLNIEKPKSSSKASSENSDSSHTFESSSGPSLKSEINITPDSAIVLSGHNACSGDAQITYLHPNETNLSKCDSNTAINLNSANNDRYDEDSLSKCSENSVDFVRGNWSVDPLSPGIDKTRNVSRLSDRAKKKSWYNVLYPNYKSRSEDFKRLFKDVRNDERLIVDYSCALYRDLLIQGRLYISQNYVCFHANILGWETCLVIKWKDVTSITKEKTALVIPNAISICTLKEKYFFSSFTTRDKTFLILFRVWQNTLMNKPMLAQEVWQLVHSYYGDELGLTSDDEDYIDPNVADDNDSSVLDFVSAIDDTNSLSLGGTESSDIDIFQAISISGSNNSSSNSATSSGVGGAGGTYNYKRHSTMKSNAKELTLISAKPDEDTTLNAQLQGSTVGAAKDLSSDRNSSGNLGKEAKHNSVSVEGKRKIPKNSRVREESASKNEETLPTDVSDSSDSEGTNIPFVATAECTSPHEGRQLVHTILPINIETLFNLLFSKSKFLLDFHAIRKSTELVFGDWVTNEEGQKTRTVNVTVQLAASVGPKTSKVTEYQLMRDCCKQGELYSIDVNNVNAGIPYADSFSVLMHYCLVKTVDDHTMLSVHAQIKYKKSIWGVVKGFIEKNTWAGLEDFYGSLLQSLQNETCIPPAKGKGRRPRRGTAVQIRPLEDIPPLQNKPEPLEHFIGAQALASRSTAECPTMVAESTNKYRWLSLFVLVLLCFLIIVNVILLLKLWRLEDRLEEDISNRARLPNLSALKKLPNNHEDWIELLRQQEMLHETELRKWHSVLQTAIELLKKTEKTLAELMFR